ncbi:MAG: GNAT family N-acetyltransferase [Phycisphaeraceae bacterium]|nr:GNAT family N-acetyltransferase [Phycisphaeraceae bacterium]
MMSAAPNQHFLARGAPGALGRLCTAVRVMGVGQGSGSSAVRTERLMIRPLREMDAREFVRAVGSSRAHLERFMPLHIPGEDDAALFARQLRQCEAGDATGRDWRRGVFDSDGRMVGGVNLNDVRRGLENRAELTIWIAAESAGRGYGREALAATIGVAFAPEAGYDGVGRGASGGLGLDRISALVSHDNEACVRLLSRLGFNRSAGAKGVEITIGDRRVAHDEYRLWARVGVLEAKPLGAFPASVGESYRRIEQVERRAEHRRF